MTIIALMAALAVPALSVFNGNEVSRAVYSVSDTLEQARAYAMSKNTYVYVGVVQDTASSATGSMVIGVVASSQGTQMFSGGTTTLPQNSSSFNQISRLLKVTNVQAVSLSSSKPTSGNPRQAVGNNYKLGDPSFDPTSNPGPPNYSFALGPYTFNSASGITSQGVTSAGMLQIDPQGAVSEVGGSSVPFFEIGLEPVNGNQANYAAIQIAGLSGSVRIYRP